MIAGEDHQRVHFPVAQVRQYLADRVGRALKPVRVFLGLLGREHLDEAGGKARETVRSGNVPVERGGLELSQNEDLGDVGINAVRDRNIDQPVLSAERNGRFGTLQR